MNSRFGLILHLAVFVCMIAGIVYSQEDDPAARLRVFAPGSKSAPLEQAWFQFNTAGHTAPVRGLCFSQDSKRLYSVGEDKVVRFWDMATGQETQCVRWRIGREHWGAIDVVAQQGGKLAFAGQAANSWPQEVWIVDAKTGDYQTILRPTGEGDCVLALAFLGSENRLASLQADGTVEIWENIGAEWVKTQTPRQRDEAVFPTLSTGAVSSRMGMIRALSEKRLRDTLIFFAGRHLVFPVPKDARGTSWNLAFFDIITKKQHVHSHSFSPITSIATDAEGKILLVTDNVNNIFFWPKVSLESLLANPPARLQTLESSRQIRNASISDAGDRLIVGTVKIACDGTARTDTARLYRWSRPAATSSSWKDEGHLVLPQNVDSCRISPDGRLIACTQGTGIARFTWMDAKKETEELLSGMRPVWRVAFAKESSYRIAWSKGIGISTHSAVFDPKLAKVESLENTNPRNAWQPVYGMTSREKWELRMEQDRPRSPEYRVYQNGRFFSKLEMNPAIHQIKDRQVDEDRNMTALWWLTDAKGVVRFLLAGTDGGSKDIFAFRLEPGRSSIVRRFRGHSAATTSLSVSTDRRYLVSGSLDCTIRFWSLAGMETASPTEQRWGMSLHQSGKALNVEKISEDSPLFLRGVRKGCRLKRIMVSSSGTDGRRQSRYVDSPREMASNIAGIDWQSQIGFEFERPDSNGKSWEALPPFAVSPTRREIAALATFDGTDDFAFWTPFGYYTASADGSHCFGWLYNRGLRGIPEFITANSFKNSLENRPVMSRLLDAGSLEAAFDKLENDARVYVPTRKPEGKPLEVVVTPVKPVPETPKPEPPPKPAPILAIAAPKPLTYDALTAKRPSVEILLPKTREELAANTIHIEASACFPADEKVRSPKLFTNGIWAGPPSKEIDQSDAAIPGVRFVKYVWGGVRLPADPYVQVKILLESEKKSFTATDHKIALRHGVSPPPRPKMYLVLLGTDYMDRRSDFPELPGVKNTVQKVRQAVENASGPMYDVEVFDFINEKATLKNWRDFVGEFRSHRLTGVNPDDMFVVYLAGHGSLDPNTGRYYFALFDTDYDDYCNCKFGNSLGFDDIAPLIDVPCRRVVILETCNYSPHQLEDPLKDYRRLEDDQFLLLLAAEPGRSAHWTDNNMIGRFSKELINGWSGGADGFDPIRREVLEKEKDGKVTFTENYSFLAERLRQVNRTTMDRQMAEIFGKDLLRYVDIPISEHDCPPETRGVRVVVTPRKPLGDITELSPQ